MKKIRVTVTEDLWRFLKKDSEEFGITNNRLCNYILEKLKYEKEIKLPENLEAETKLKKKIIQFDLNVANENIYYDILKENRVEIEAEFFRELFQIYSSKFKYQRELFIFREKVNLLLKGIKEKRKIKIFYLGDIYIINPYFIKREEQGDENFIFSYNETLKQYENFKLKELEVIDILQSKVEIIDKKYVEQVRKNFDPFLGNGNIIKVKLTTVGEALLKSLTNYRPKLKKKDGNIYSFEISNENAKLYFSPFMKEAEILEPLSLREEMKKALLETLDIYQ
ncbi:WYL domain-containing protein [Cetobacterium sp. SF1]|uniref:WYL domain-containing protein n=1 Tax=unclassified Cetobacterium TaxID=2630983 RepID=UPI003CF1A881